MSPPSAWRKSPASRNSCTQPTWVNPRLSLFSRGLLRSVLALSGESSRQIFAQTIENLFGLGPWRVVQVLAKEDQIALPAVLNMTRFHKAVVLSGIGHVFDRHMPLIEAAVELLRLRN